MRAMWVAVATTLGLWALPAGAFTWMIRHEYPSCTTCHADPSGGGLLTPYGRAQADLLLKWRAKPAPAEGEEEVASTAGFLWGAVEPPEWLNVSGNVRVGGMARQTPGSDLLMIPLVMAADLRAQVSVDRFRGYLSLGYAYSGAAPAALLPRAQQTLVSREHWLGMDFADGAVLVRAGRMNLPFGLRNLEHTSWVRSVTRTDMNVSQQHGLAVAYNGEGLRGELMGIMGNLQVSPDAYRERGAAGFAELSPRSNLAVGVSGLVTHAQRDIATRQESLRQVYGAHVRYAPWRPLVVLGEADALIQRVGQNTSMGYVGFLQADYEPVQGLHLVATAEALDEGLEPGVGPSLGGWLSAVWYVAPHVDLRLDVIQRRVAQAQGPLDVTTGLLQLHFFL